MSFSETALLEALPEAILWVAPVVDPHGEVADFEVGYGNRAAHAVLGAAPASLKGRHVRRDGIPDAAGAEANFRHFLHVLQTGAPQEYFFDVTASGKRYFTERVPYEGGVLSITRDRSAQEKAEAREQQKTILLDGIVAHAPAGILVYRAQRDAAGPIQDFQLELCNERAHELSGIPEPERTQFTFRQLMQRIDAEPYYDRYVSLVETGTPQSFEYYYAATGRWVLVSSVKLGDGFTVLLSDITPEKKIQEALQQESDFSALVLEASLNGIYVLESVVDDHGNITDFLFVRANQQFKAFTGLDPEKILGQSLLTLFPHTRQTGMFAAFCGVMEHTEVMQGTAYYAQAFQRWFDYSAVKMGARHLVVTFQDVTAQREVQERVEQQKNLLDNILRYSPAGITVTEVIRDADGTIIDGRTLLSNEAAEQFTGMPGSLNATHTIGQIDPAILESPLYKMALQTLATGVPFFTQYFFAPTQRWLELSVSRLDDDRLINVFLDITQSKEAQLQQERLIAELRRSNANLEEFTYASSHDLKEPIRKIHIFIDQLQGKLSARITDDERYLFGRIQRSARRMQLLIDDLLNYSLVSLDTAFSLEETVDLNQKLKLVLEDLELMIEEKGATVRVGALPRVKGHRRQLQQLFSNLVSNALKYTRPGVAPEIAIRCRDVRGGEIAFPLSIEEQATPFYEIEVADNGIGFSPEEAERIFHVFERLHVSEYEGTGIGLAIVRKVVENHKGYITVESAPGAGTAFRVYLRRPE
ncbi:MAG: PAS domain-containing protein [Chitinophagaceae bacterium]|nr:MAG: PAS domain-containing protein [Chitinophagaceae bacterium]